MNLAGFLFSFFFFLLEPKNTCFSIAARSPVRTARETLRAVFLVAYFKDFPRGYFIASTIDLAVFLMLFLNQPVYPIIIGILIALPGLVLFVRFLKKYPLYKEDICND